MTSCCRKKETKVIGISPIINLNEVFEYQEERKDRSQSHMLHNQSALNESPVRVGGIWERVPDREGVRVLQGNTHVSNVYLPQEQDDNLNIRSTKIENMVNYLPRFEIKHRNQEQFNVTYDAMCELQKRIQALEHEKDDVDVNSIVEEKLLSVSDLLENAKENVSKINDKAIRNIKKSRIVQNDDISTSISF